MIIKGLNQLSSPLNFKSMKSHYAIFFILTIPLFLSSCTSEIKHTSSNSILIGTFNIAWLGDGISDNISRNEPDYKRIADIITASGVDLLGVEEIENPSAIEKVMKYLPDFKYYLSNSGGVQNVGILYKRDILLSDSKDYLPLVVEPNKTRPGITAQVKSGNFDFIIMVVHLKSTSSYDSTEELKLHSYQIRNRQSKLISDWADSIFSTSKEKDIVIVGDFNDSPTRNNCYITPLAENSNLTLLSQNIMSCKFQYAGSIDHIVTSRSVLSRYITNSIHLYDIYSAYNANEIELISDHCPLIATFKVSDKDTD